MPRFLIYLSIICALPSVLPESPATPAPAESSEDEPPEGYYAFVESPNATPPRVRPPPYRQVSTECASLSRPAVSAHNLCGDLNRGVIPKNPMKQGDGEPYPFELIRNHTLRFLSRTLPVLRADDTLPRVARVPGPGQPPAPVGHDGYAGQGQLGHDGYSDNQLEDRTTKLEDRSGLAEPDTPANTRAPTANTRTGRALASELPVEHRSDEPRESRKFCDNGGVFCMLYRAINGEGAASGPERREDPGAGAGAGAPTTHQTHQTHQAPRYEGPPTPCPARVEYATPVFARNYHGVWRYVVQIPYEGYFTQTVEVTRCMQSRCHYLDGGCLSSPRWVSLLVAEMHYPQQDYQPSTATAGGATAAPSDKPHCDGHDEMGCYQVRLYYDWFLVPGSCKCWRPDYFARYVRRRAGEL